MSDKLFELPEYWEWAIASEVCASVRDGTHDSPKYYDSGIPLVTSKNLRDGQIDFSTAKLISLEDHQLISVRSGVEPGDVLFAMIGTIGNPVVVGEAKEFSIKNVGLFKKKESALDSNYLKYWLDSRSFQQILEQQDLIKGTTQKFLPLGTLRNLPVPLSPLNEQKRIVAKIEELRDRSHRAKQALEAIPELCDRFRQSVLAAAFRGDLTADWREENPDVEPASVLLERIRQEKPNRKHEQIEDSLPAPFTLPSNWVWSRLIDVCISISDGDHQAPPKVEKGIPFLVISNIRDSKLDFSETRYVPEKYYQTIQEVRKPAKGDILYSVVGSYGIPVLVDTEEKFCFQRHIALLKPSCSISAKYLLYALKSNFIFQQATEAATGTAQLTVPLSGLRKIRLAVPPLLEQHTIVQHVEAFLEAVTQIEQQHQGAEAELSRLNQSVLAKAFRGELVEQDPNDEPASVLLDRIRAERQAQEGKKSGGTRGKRKKASDDQMDLPGMRKD